MSTTQPTQPTQLSERNLIAAIESFVDVLGPGAVETDAVALRAFRDPYAYRESDEWDSSAAVAPTTTEQVQAVVRIANLYNIPLWTIGQGRNYTYGGAAPRLRGSVIVNLRQMSQVLEVNQDLCYAVVQPGVRFFDLHDALEAAGGRCWLSLPDLGWGSVMGNALEYGRGYTSYGDHALNVCGMEVVLPDGEILRTGMGGQTGNPAWHVYPHSYGPSLDRIFMQSNYGIVTQMGVWLMPRPEWCASCGAMWQGEEALAAVAETIRDLLLEGIIRSYPAMARGIGILDDKPFIDPAVDIWRLRFALYGREHLVDANLAIVQEALGRVRGVEVFSHKFRGVDRHTESQGHDDNVQCGIPDMDFMELFKTPFGEDTAHLDFSPVGPLVGEDLVATYQLVREMHERHRWPYFCGMLMSPRSVIYVTTAFFDPHDEQRTCEVYEAYKEMLLELAKAGKVPYRTNIHHMDIVADQLNYNNHIQRRVNEQIKNALDPKGILGPGKQGIWPANQHFATS